MRVLRGSGEVQTGQSQPMTGTPTEVPVPRKVRDELMGELSAKDQGLSFVFGSRGDAKTQSFDCCEGIGWWIEMSWWWMRAPR
ncbi:MAG: hypothetical protein AAGC74_12420 [Verrucomicrobiota bacterium]